MNPSVKYGKDRWEYLVCNGKTSVGRYLTKKGEKKLNANVKSCATSPGLSERRWGFQTTK